MTVCAHKYGLIGNVPLVHGSRNPPHAWRPLSNYSLRYKFLFYLCIFSLMMHRTQWLHTRFHRVVKIMHTLGS